MRRRWGQLILAQVGRRLFAGVHRLLFFGVRFTGAANSQPARQCIGLDSLKATEVTSTDAKTYRDHLLAKRYAPTTINRDLISLMLFFDTLDGTNPFRNLTMIDIVEPAPVALSKTEWNAVRRCAEAAARRDHGLALALATLFRYAGSRVSEVAALQIPDVHVSARCGLTLTMLKKIGFLRATLFFLRGRGSMS